MYILFSFLMIAFGTPRTLFGMDDTPTPISLTEEWLNLAHDFHLYNSPFKILFADVQGRITAQVHPCQTIDELVSDHFILVRELTVPHIIASWDMKDDNFVYFTKKERNTNFHEDEDHFDMYRLKLTYGKNTQILKDETVYENPKPKLAICSSSVVFERCRGGLSILNLKEPEDRMLLACKNTGYANFACHQTLPLFAIVDTEEIVEIYNADEKVVLCRSYFPNAPSSHASKNLQWHPIFPFAMATKKHVNGDTYLHHFGLPEKNEIIMKGNFNLFCGTPCIPYDGKTIWGGSGSPCARIISNYSCIPHEYARPAEIKNSTLRAVGEHYYLTEDKEEKSENTCFTLRSAETKEEVKQITSFKNYDPTFFRLPQNHDYRYLTITVDKQKPKSTIFIAVPASKACIEHYCMFQAALSTEKAEQELENGSDFGDGKEVAKMWNLFKNPQYTTLIKATATHYPHFKRLMEKNNIMKA